MTENNGGATTLRELLAQGKQKGSLTTKEITDVLEELNFDAEQINGIYLPKHGESHINAQEAQYAQAYKNNEIHA